MGRGRPKGSKNKPKERTENAQERSAHRDVVGENEESKSDHDRDSDLPATMEDNRQITSTTIAESDGESYVENPVNGNAEDQQQQGAENIAQQGADNEDQNNEFIFDEDDIYGPLFCKLALLPQADIWMNEQRWKDCRKAIGNLCREYTKEQSDENLFNILSFWKLVKGRGVDKTIKENIKRLSEGKGREMLIKRLQEVQISEMPVTQANLDGEENDFLSDNEIARATKLVEKGAISKAAAIIEKSTKGVAPLTADTLKELIRLNPKGLAQPFGEGAGPEAPILNNIGILSAIISDLNKQASAGIDGWTVQRVQLCFG